MRYAITFFLLALLVVGCKTSTTIANDLSERDANEIVVLLQSRGVLGEKIPAPASTTGGGSKAQMWNISVPARQITESLAILNQSGLPRIKSTSLLDLFGAKGLVPSEMENKIRYQEGLSEQLGSTIRKMDGIIDANVQITFTQEDDEEHDLTASVYVKHRGILDNPNSLLITKIKRLISASVPGLTAENVSVISDRALISDISLESLNVEEDQDLVSVWGVVVARTSMTSLQLILYCFIFAIFLLACVTVWTLWKAYPLILRHGYKSFFHPKPYDATIAEEDITIADSDTAKQTQVEQGVFDVESKQPPPQEGS